MFVYLDVDNFKYCDWYEGCECCINYDRCIIILD